MIKKELYAAPATEVLVLRLEGVIAGSINNGLEVSKNSIWGDKNDDYQDWE